MQEKVGLIFPHQLFESNPLLEKCNRIYIVEEYLFFRQYDFHTQKLIFHRASMKAYEDMLQQKGIEIIYIESEDSKSDVRLLLKSLEVDHTSLELHYIDPVDDWLNKRILHFENKGTIDFVRYESPLFLNTSNDLKDFFKPDKKFYFQTSFYKAQRKRLGLLLDADDKPIGGQWTFDKENRKKYPRNKLPPSIQFPDTQKYWTEAVQYVENQFPASQGASSTTPIYPTNHEEARDWLKQFLDFRFHEFGPYEDAIVKEHAILNHSLLSPLINVGLIDPNDLIQQSIAFAEAEEVPINSVEGFIRQIIGWREFIRGMYQVKGTYSRTRNFWNFKRKIPRSFYDGTTGIEPFDVAIKKVLQTGYCHHIERLMVLGNFMFLCEIDPDEVYRWFMELFIDAYDWVMVPNIYGMSQFSDGGSFATKPYISGSNYIKKMSDYKPGPWQETWDGLFWRFIDKNTDFFRSNPRLSMMVHTWNKKGKEKQQQHLDAANLFLSQLK